MIEELDSLKEKYQHMFPERFFFECDNGWYNILSSLLYRINKHEEHVRQNNAYRVRHGRDPVEYQKVKIVQIKEKFAGLRFYYDGGDEYIGEGDITGEITNDLLKLGWTHRSYE